MFFLAGLFMFILLPLQVVSENALPAKIERNEYIEPCGFI
jgi:hypothetical protein